MVYSLSAFNSGSAAPPQRSVTDFQPARRPSPAANSATINTLASYGAALSPEDQVERTYTSVTNELMNSPSSRTLEQVITNWDNSEFEASFDTLRGLMLDPNITDEDKQSMLTDFSGHQANNSLFRRVATAASMAPSEGETEEAENIRVNASLALDEVDAYNAWVQQNINAVESEINPEWYDNVYNFIGMMVPFAEASDQAFFEQALSEASAGEAGGVGNITQTLLLLGEGRERLRKTLDRMPLEQRSQVAEALMQVIRTTNGTVSTNVNDVRAIQTLSQMLTPGGYTETDRWVDNIFSVLDDTILLAPFVKGVRAAGGAIGGMRTAGRAELAADIMRRGEDAAENISEAARTTQDELLQIEYRPTGQASYINDVDAVVDGLPVEVPSGELNGLRRAINEGIYSRDGLDIDEVISSSNVFDGMSNQQITDFRRQLGDINLRRQEELTRNAPSPVPTISEIRPQVVKGAVQPTSVSQIYRQTNPQKARTAHAIMVQDTTGRGAEVLYGATRANALAHDFLPEIAANGRVKSKIEFDDGVITPDTEILRKHKEGRGDLQYKSVEKQEARAKVVQEWRSLQGLTARSAMSTFEDISSGIRMQATYGPKDGGFSNAYEGIETLRLALRKYGINENDMTVLSRQKDGTYGPPLEGTSFNNGDFLIQVKHDYQFAAGDFEYRPFENSAVFSKFDIKAPGERSGGQGGLFQQAIPKSVWLDSNVFSSGVVAADRASGLQIKLLQYGERMAKNWRKLDAVQKQYVDQYIRRANDEELVFNVGKIKANGIKDEGVEFLVNWKTVQDTIYALENADVNKTLRNRGFQYFEDRVNNTKLIAKPLARGSHHPLRRYYTTENGGEVRTFTNAEIEEIYAKGGTAAELRRPLEFDGEQVEYVLSRNTNSGGYLRGVRDDDITLNYRHGYYHVKYNDPYYITRTKDGRTETIARAGALADARAEVARLTKAGDGWEYDWKHDRNLSTDARFDDELDVAFASGRSAQRMRGKRLERVGNDKGVSDLSVESPLESFQRSVASIATRTAFRDVIDADKRRWMKQYGHMLERRNGVPVFPNDLNDIATRHAKYIGEAAEARNTWRYITNLESGYTNLIDDASKMFFNAVGDVGARKGWGWLESIGKNAARVNPSGTVRMSAFRLFLASNPAGQLLLQVAPAFAIINTTNPLRYPQVFQRYFFLRALNRGVEEETARKIIKAAGLTPEEGRAIWDDYIESGMSSAVNAHSYLADDLGRLADMNMGQKALSVAGAPLRFTQKIGFDFGEQSLIDLLWLSERDRMTRQLGRQKLTPEERDTLTARVRAMSGDMNRGGDLPYNSNTLSVGLQFFQNVHKIAANLILGHRGLSNLDRAKLVAGFTVTFGLPFDSIVDKTVDAVAPGNQELRDLIKGGLTNIVFNNFLSMMSGEEVRLDFSERLQPFTIDPVADLVNGIISGTVPELLAGGAAPSLFSEGGRIAEFFKAVARPFTPNDYQSIDEFQQIGLTFLQMFSGASNTMKALYVMEHGKIVTASGQTVDNEVSYMEGLMRAAGFQTMDEVHYWAGQEAEWAASDRIQGDVETIVDDLFRMYARQNLDVNSWEAYNDVMSEASRVFNNHPQYMQRVADYVSFKVRNDPETFYRNVFQRAGLYSREEMMKIINRSNFTQDQVDTLMELNNRAGEAYGN